MRGSAELGVAAVAVAVELNIPIWMVTQKTLSLSSMFFKVTRLVL